MRDIDNRDEAQSDSGPDASNRAAAASSRPRIDYAPLRNPLAPRARRSVSRWLKAAAGGGTPERAVRADAAEPAVPRAESDESARQVRDGVAWLQGLAEQVGDDQLPCRSAAEICSLLDAADDQDLIDAAAALDAALNIALPQHLEACRREMAGTAPAAGPRILLVEDDRHTRAFIAENLGADGFAVTTAGNASAGRRLVEVLRPDLAIVDTLPAGDGLELLKWVRGSDGVASRVDATLPIVVLSARVGEPHRLRPFECGADDVLGKPFSYPELRARVHALLRRARRPPYSKLRIGALEIDVVSHTATLGGTPVAITQKEFALLRTLAAAPSRVFTKEELLQALWGDVGRYDTRKLDTHACRLRQKLARDGDRFVINVWGIGYRLVDSLPRPE